MSKGKIELDGELWEIDALTDFIRLVRAMCEKVQTQNSKPVMRSVQIKESAYTERIQELAEQRRKLAAGIHNLLHIAEMSNIKLIVTDEMQAILDLVGKENE